MVLTCPYCRETIAEGAAQSCPACRTPHHHDCWEENGGCTVFGCEHAPAEEAKIAVTAGEIGGPPLAIRASYLVHRQGEQLGPYSFEEMERHRVEGRISPDDLVWCDGMPEWLPMARVINRNHPVLSPSHAIPSGADGKPIFFYIPISRLVVMSVLSMGLFSAFWMYRNWRFLKERDQLNISPFWRGIFGVFFIHSLLKEISTDKATSQISVPAFNASGLATGWVVLQVLGRILGRFGGPPLNLLGTLVAQLAFSLLIPVQAYLNSVNESVSPPPGFSPWSTGHFVCLVLGILSWLVIVTALMA